MRDGLVSNKPALLRSKPRAAQQLVFDGMEFGGNRYPTDIDGFMEFSDKVYAFFEVKYQDAPMSRGQEIALARLCDIVQRSGRESILVLCSHSVHDSSSDVALASCIVIQYRYKFKWHIMTERRTVKDVIDCYLKNTGIV